MAFFEDINLGLDAIVLALKCILFYNSVHFFTDSQTALDICKLELNVNWHKIKDYSGVLGNKYANALVDTVSFSFWYLLLWLKEYYIVAESGVVSDNSRYFHPDLHMAADFTNKTTVNTHMYFMKALHYQLPIVV
ncbi:hypothetical protein G9A89_010798 [Geosiphon pyriformis]|nr:hypothetical protein G9A89_010798 [Geosiphon pyriformis]